VDTDDGETEAVVLADAASAVLTAIAAETGVEIDESVVVDRWAEVRRSIESGHAVTVLRDGRPWAIITPP
jgi:proteasome assembly chaperone (PAC2) family protein